MKESDVVLSFKICEAQFEVSITENTRSMHKGKSFYSPWISHANVFYNYHGWGKSEVITQQ